MPIFFRQATFKDARLANGFGDCVVDVELMAQRRCLHSNQIGA